MLLVKVIRNFGIVRKGIEYVKVQERVRKVKQQHFGTYTTL